jgi:hypothetical protein
MLFHIFLISPETFGAKLVALKEDNGGRGEDCGWENEDRGGRDEPPLDSVGAPPLFRSWCSGGNVIEMHQVEVNEAELIDLELAEE